MTLLEKFANRIIGLHPIEVLIQQTLKKISTFVGVSNQYVEKTKEQVAYTILTKTYGGESMKMEAVFVSDGFIKEAEITRTYLRFIKHIDGKKALRVDVQVVSGYPDVIMLQARFIEEE